MTGKQIGPVVVQRRVSRPAPAGGQQQRQHQRG